MRTTSPLPPCLESDSDSDLSLEDDRSGSYASTHSSDSEDEEGPLAPDECWENLASSSGKRPHTRGRDARAISWDVTLGHGSHRDMCLDNRMSCPTDKGSGRGELSSPDRSKPDVQNRPDSGLGHNAGVFSDSRTQDGLTLLLPGVSSLGAPPHRGKVQPHRRRLQNFS